MVCLHTQYLHVEYHEQDNILLNQWYGPCSSLQYRQALILSLRLARKNNIDFAIIDRRLLPPLSESDLIWTAEVYQKALSTLPLKRFAIVKSFNETAEKQHAALLKRSDCPTNIEVRTFNDLTSAYDWLMAVKA